MERSLFISYSTEDEKLMELFKQLLIDLGYRVDPFNYSVDTAPVNKERELIQKADGFVGLITKQEGREFSPSVITEIGMAIGMDKPMQLFVFDGLDVTKLPSAGNHTPAIVSIHERMADGEILLDSKNVRGIFKALYNFDDRMVNLYDSKNNETDRFIYKSFEIFQEIKGPKELHLLNNVTAVPLKPWASHTHEGTLFCDTGQKDGVMLKDGNWEFRLLRPKDVTENVRIVQNGRKFFRFNFDFAPPIQAGTEMSYAYSRDPENYFPYTHEELEAAFEKELITHKLLLDNQMIGQDFRITRKTEKLTITLKFPRGYPIDEWEAFACPKGTDVSDSHESTRTMQASRQEYDEFYDFHTLIMELDNPAKDFIYFLLYKPPHEAWIKK